MKLRLQRDVKTPAFTLGRFLIDDVMSYFTVERPWLNNQPQISCIPEGKYRLLFTDSPKFGRPLPRLMNVPDRDGILIHPANVASELEGCIAIGMKRSKSGVEMSKMACNDFQAKLLPALGRGGVWITIN